MEETHQETTPQAEGMSRLEQEFSGETETTEETPVETTEETTETGLQDGPENKEAETAEAKTETTEETKAEETVEEEKPFEFADETPPEEGTWADLIETLGFEKPEDFSEEKGVDVLKQIFETQAKEREEKALQLSEATLISKYPEELQGQAAMMLDLMKHGKTLDEIQAPLREIKELKSLPKEALVRKALENIPGWDEDMVNSEMERIAVSPNGLDIEYKKTVTKLDSLEQEMTQENQKQLQYYNTQAKQLQEQKKQKEFESFKKALDGEKTFMDIPLKDSNKEKLIRDYQTNKDQILNDPKKLARFMLFDQYGEQAAKHVLVRAQEKATLAAAKKKHNIPQVVSAGGGRATPGKTFATGEERLAHEYKE